MTRILGRQITYRNPSSLRFLIRRLRTGTPFIFAIVMSGLYLSTRSGMAQQVTGTVAQLLGRQPIFFEQYVRDNRHLWLPE